MDVKLHRVAEIYTKTIAITGSKSETNRLLLLKALYPGITVQNISVSDDSDVMRAALAGNDTVIDVHHAGTAMRFLTAYFAVQEGREVMLTGSPRMRERPIGILVTALRSLGADIEYTGTEGYPPLRIKGKELTGDKVSMKADISSQYITALLLIAGRLQKGLDIILEGNITSLPYIRMTLALLNDAGIKAEMKDNIISVSPADRHLPSVTVTVESDWSSASYFYSIIALSPISTTVTLSSFKENSLQGDSALAVIYEQLGVVTAFNGTAITLRKQECQPQVINLDLNNTPDIAQTIAVTCLGLGIGCSLEGLHTLKIKETDRLTALKTELEKFGADVTLTGDSLHLSPSRLIKSGIAVDTYNDHRMAMAFAPLTVKTSLIIKDAAVVSKSYPTFWEDLKSIGFPVEVQ
jgi:3-phosphoshikimate 1-carboxyvinyltransferase